MTATKIIPLDLTESELATLIDLLNEASMDLEDDGNEGNPDAELLNKVVKQLWSWQSC